MTDTATRAREESRAVARDAAGRGRAVARTAQERAGTVVEDARQHAAEVAGEARSQVEQAAGDTRRRLREEADDQAGKVADSLHRIAGELRALHDGRPDDAEHLRPHLDRAGEQLERAARHLEQRGIDGLVEDVQTFARRRPGVFLAAALGTGFLAGRVVRSLRDDGEASPGTGPRTSSNGAGAGGSGTAGGRSGGRDGRGAA